LYSLSKTRPIFFILSSLFTKFSMTYYQTDSRPLWSLCIEHVIYHHLFAMKLKFMRNFSVLFHHISSAKKNYMLVGNVLKNGCICILSNSSYFICFEKFKKWSRDQCSPRKFVEFSELNQPKEWAYIYIYIYIYFCTDISTSELP